jgi:uncharacterized protein (TIGR00299 family) protein
MKALLLDPYAGASGDMIMGCLLDLGADPEAVTAAVESVGCRLEVTSEERGHIVASRARVVSDRRYQSLEEAKKILEESSLGPSVLDKARRIMDVLAGAEAMVHGIEASRVRFHELGALDALADIAGSCAALESLSPKKILCLPISVGGGLVKSAHGFLPVPGPAALEILRSHRIPWKGGPVDQELLTPTGASILAAIVDSFLDFYPEIRAQKVGYGAGSSVMPLPNALRGILGEVKVGHDHSVHAIHSVHPDQVAQLETNLDDVTGEVLGYLIERLMEVGALDVSVLPALMKKGRPGHVIRVIAREKDLERLAGMIMAETGSLGLRVFPSLHRYTAEREEKLVRIEVKGRSYQVALKVNKFGGSILKAKPEYEDCRRIALEADVPLRDVIKMAEDAEGRDIGS